MVSRIYPVQTGLQSACRVDGEAAVGATKAASTSEGCFHIGISKNKTMKLGYQVIPELTIVQHIKDIKLLHAIKDYLKCGIVQSNRGKNDTNDK